MTGTASSWNLFLYGILPYVALAVFFIVTIERYKDAPYSYSSLASQFLENEQHFYALVPFHYGLLGVLTGHLLGLLIPRQILLWNAVPIRLYVLEITGLMLGLLTLVGIVAGVARRLNSSKVKCTTYITDWVVYALLLIQVITGIGVAVFHPWGSSWFASTASPYLWSLLTFNPQLGYVQAMPWLAKWHIVNAFLIVGFFPFTRLVHVLVVPNPYLWRKPQVVRWYADRRSMRKIA